MTALPRYEQTLIATRGAACRGTSRRARSERAADSRRDHGFSHPSRKRARRLAEHGQSVRARSARAAQLPRWLLRHGRLDLARRRSAGDARFSGPVGTAAAWEAPGETGACAGGPPVPEITTEPI